jgi:hypothetical protein
MTKVFPSCVFLFVCVVMSRSPLAQTAQKQRNVSDVVKATVDSVVLILVTDDTGKSSFRRQRFHCLV